MSLEDQLFENMPTKSIKFIDQVINTSLKNEDEEKNRTFLWKNVLKTGFKAEVENSIKIYSNR